MERGSDAGREYEHGSIALGTELLGGSPVRPSMFEKRICDRRGSRLSFEI